MNERRGKKSRFALLANRSAIAGLLSLLVIIAYVADLGLQTSRQFPGSGASGERAAAQASSAEKIATQITSVRFDQQGVPSHHFQSELIEYYLQAQPQAAFAVEDLFDEGELLFSDGDKQQLFTVKSVAPVFRLYEAGELVAEAYSDIAIGNARNSRTELIGSVKLVYTANQSSLKTERLMLNPDSKQVLTRERVLIEGPSYRTTALGLQGNVTDQRWQLLADVKTTVTPRQ